MEIEGITTGPLASVAELIDLSESVENLLFAEPGMMIAYRGQPQEFKTLTPSFRRQLPGDSVGTAALIEQNLMHAFRKHYKELKDRSPDMPRPEQIDVEFDLRCLSVMQHYEIPTRLLDWTSDFWTAVYFACASDPTENAELWYYDRRLFYHLTQNDPSLASLLINAPNPPHEPEFHDLREELKIKADLENLPSHPASATTTSASFFSISVTYGNCIKVSV